MVAFASSIMKNILLFVFPCRVSFSVKLICFTRLFYKWHFYKQHQAKIAKHPEAKLSLFENYSYSLKISKNKQMCLHSWDYAINYIKNEDKNKKKIK